MDLMLYDNSNLIFRNESKVFMDWSDASWSHDNYKITLTYKIKTLKGWVYPCKHGLKRFLLWVTRELFLGLWILTSHCVDKLLRLRSFVVKIICIWNFARILIKPNIWMKLIVSLLEAQNYLTHLTKKLQDPKNISNHKDYKEAVTLLSTDEWEMYQFTLKNSSIQ